MSLQTEKPLDPRAIFDPLYRRYHRRAYGVAFRMMGNQADAEDLTQETFMRAFRFFGRYQPNLPFDTWLYKIMSNLFVDTCRRRHPRHQVQSLDCPLKLSDTDREIFFDVPDADADPARIVLSQEMDERLHVALARLPRCNRTAVTLVDIEGLTYEEASKALGCSLGATRSRLHRGRRLLRQLLMAMPIS